jgi:hypothetical protein
MSTVWTNRDLLRIITSFQDGVFEDLIPHIKTPYYCGYDARDKSQAALFTAIARNDLHVVQRLFACQPHMFASTSVMDLAASFGHIHLLHFLHSVHCPCTTSAMDSAAQNGFLDVVEFLHTHRSEGATSFAMNCAIREDHQEIVSFFLNHRPERYSFSAPTRDSKIDILKRI